MLIELACIESNAPLFVEHSEVVAIVPRYDGSGSYVCFKTTAQVEVAETPREIVEKLCLYTQMDAMKALRLKEATESLLREIEDPDIETLDPIRRTANGVRTILNSLSRQKKYDPLAPVYSD